MNYRMISAGPLRRILCAVLAMTMAFGPSAASTVAQTNAAQQAVRQRVQGLDARPDEPPSQQADVAPGDQILLADPSAGKIDTTHVSPSAVAIIVLRPAQIMSASMAEMLPTEVATAAGLHYLGIDPANVDEAVGFLELSNPVAPAYGLTIQFNQPFRGAAIPPHARPYAQLSELAGRKYLQSAHPLWPSFYGTSKTTLVAAPDATLRQLVETTGQSKPGPLLDRVRDVPAGNDLYLALDVASLRPLIQMGLAQAGSNLPPEAQPFFKLPELIAAAELTLNLSAAGPTSLVVHGNDEAAAQQLESLIMEAVNQNQEKMRAALAAQSAGGDPVQQAMAQYTERLSARWIEQLGPRRDGASLTFFHPEAQDPSQKGLMNSVGIGMLIGLLMPALKAARNAAQPVETSESTEQPPAADSAP